MDFHLVPSTSTQWNKWELQDAFLDIHFTPQLEYQVIQSNGQRIYCLTSVVERSLKKPPRGSEVFVGNIPRNVLEDTLIPILSKHDPIYKFRLMMDFSGNTRGFGFVCYFTAEAASRAVYNWNNYELRKGLRITVHLSLDNCRLFVGSIPRCKTPEEVKSELMELVEGVTDVIVYEDIHVHGYNRGFAFVEFATHAMAAIARRKMVAGFITLWGRNKIFVDWADPEPIVDPILLNQVTILYLRNIPEATTAAHLKCHLMSNCKNVLIEKVYKRDNYAFIHFYTKADAEEAYKYFNQKNLIIQGRQLEVEWARPPNFSKRIRWNKTPNNLCMSVPPKMRKLIEEKKNRRLNNNMDGNCFAGRNYYNNDTNSINDLDMLSLDFDHMTQI